VLYKSVIIINTRALPCSLARCNVHWSAAALSGALPHSLEHCRTHWSAAMFTGALPHSVERYRTQWSTAARVVLKCMSKFKNARISALTF